MNDVYSKINMNQETKLYAFIMRTKHLKKLIHKYVMCAKYTNANISLLYLI